MRRGLPRTHINLVKPNPFRRMRERLVIRSALAARAGAVFGHFVAESVGAQVRYLAEKINGRLRIGGFQFAIGGTHAAQRLNAATAAAGFARFLFRAGSQ